MSEDVPEPVSEAPEPLSVASLRWRCDPSALSFETTAELTPIPGIVGQDEAIEALRFGVEIHAKGQNVYVRGLQGTGRLTMVRHLLEEIRPLAPKAPDLLYVCDFEHPDRPRLITVGRGQGKLLCDKLGELRRFIVRELGVALDGEPLLSSKRELERESMREVEALTQPLEQQLREQGLALLIGQAGGVARPVIMPLVDGEPVAPERFGALIREGKLSSEALERLGEASEAARQDVDATFRRVAERQRGLRAQVREMVAAEAERLLQEACAELRERFPEAAVGAYLDALIHDVVQRRLPELDSIDQVAHLYEANLLSGHELDEPSPVVVDNAPSLRSLLGTLDTMVRPDGSVRADHTSVRAGSLVRADGGVLVLEVTELIAHPGAWSALVRTLRSGRVQLVMPEVPLLVPLPSLKPEPIPVDVKVVLVGDSRLYHLLDALDPDFPHLFKVLVD
ncbi:MAG: ATP-binding protein, partial [Nannocystaceae bacterium]